MAQLKSIGLEMPDDYPIMTHDEIQDRMQRLADSIGAKELIAGFSAAWNAVGYRYRGCVDAGEAFRDSLVAHGQAPANPERYLQERQFYEFIVSGFSCLEAATFAIHMVGTFIDPTQFPFNTVQDRIKITPSRVKDRIGSFFAGSKLDTGLATLIESAEWKEWKEIRNYLAHRGLPGRHFFMGGGQSTYQAFDTVPGFELSRSMIQSRRQWLSEQLTTLGDNMLHLLNGRSIN